MPSPYNGNSQHATSAIAATGVVQVDGLLGSTQWARPADGGPLVLTYSFAWAGGAAVFDGNYSSLREPSQGSALGALQQQAVREALAAWAAVANVRFVEVAETADVVGDLRFAVTGVGNMPGATAWAYYPHDRAAAGGDVWITRSAIDTYASARDWQSGGEGFATVLHEIGHALGLKHSFEGTPALPEALDNRQYTVMTYSLHPHGIYGEVTAAPQGGQNYEYWALAPQTPMLFDIAAAQHLYGANDGYRTGDDFYDLDPLGPTLRTLWDAGGHDTLSAARFTKGVTLDLNPGAYSSLPAWQDPHEVNPQWPFNYGENNLAIAWGTVIENAIGGSGDDVLLGNDANNRLQGGAGNDWLDGRGGIDTAVFTGLRASYSLSFQDGTVIVADSQAARDGTDTLVHIERLAFADTRVALDIGGNAGFVAELIGAVYGADYVRNPALVAVGLDYADGGTSREQLTRLALEDRLGMGFDSDQCIALLYQNVVGAPVPEFDLQHWRGTLASGQYTTTTLALMALATPENALSIDLAGLQAQGLAYL